MSWLLVPGAVIFSAVFLAAFFLRWRLRISHARFIWLVALALAFLISPLFVVVGTDPEGLLFVGIAVPTVPAFVGYYMWRLSRQWDMP